MRACTLEELEAVAQQLAEKIVAPTTFFLWGDLGAGKTAFARAFLRAYSGDATLEVPSPTFTLVQIYGIGSSKEVWHADLYRLKHEEELEELGLTEALYSKVCLIEWPDVLEDWDFPHRLDIHLKVLSETERELTILNKGKEI